MKQTYPGKVTTLGPQLVDLRLGNVGTFLSLLHLMLNLPVPGQVGVGLLLLKNTKFKSTVMSREYETHTHKLSSI